MESDGESFRLKSLAPGATNSFFGRESYWKHRFKINNILFFIQMKKAFFLFAGGPSFF